MTRQATAIASIVLMILACGAILSAQESPKPANRNVPTKVQPPPGEQERQPPEETSEDAHLPAQPTPEEIIRAFQRDRPESVPVPPARLEARETPEERYGTLIREGEFISDRTGRLGRDDNWWTFEFESDALQAPHPPMRLLPNQMLERIVRESEASPNATYIVSGEVTLYDFHNYLLLRKVLRRRSTDNLSK
jgi:hypothetical protein